MAVIQKISGKTYARCAPRPGPRVERSLVAGKTRDAWCNKAHGFAFCTGCWFSSEGCSFCAPARPWRQASWSERDGAHIARKLSAHGAHISDEFPDLVIRKLSAEAGHAVRAALHDSRNKSVPAGCRRSTTNPSAPARSHLRLGRGNRRSCTRCTDACPRRPHTHCSSYWLMSGVGTRATGVHFIQRDVPSATCVPDGAGIENALLALAAGRPKRSQRVASKRH